MKKSINLKIKNGTRSERTIVFETTYDYSYGVVRITDDSIDSGMTPSLSPIKLNRTLRRNIKKPIRSKNAF